MSDDFLPPANVDAAKPFEVSDTKINLTAALLGASVLFVIYPAYALLRSLWGIEGAFSWSSTAVALVCAVLFGLNVRRRVGSLARVADD